MPAQETIYKIFIASPSGLKDERKAFADVIEEYNKSDAQHRGVSFRAVGWEDTLAGMGRPQDTINKELKECDFFLLLLHNRWGSNPGKNAHDATSGTEEEFNLAMDCYKDENSHMKQIVCVFKSVDAAQLADPGKQLQKVIKFKKKLEREKKLLYSQFFSVEEYKTIVRRQLGRWLLNHENDTKRNQKIEVDTAVIPEKTIDRNADQLKVASKNKDTEAIIENAKKLADEGKLVEAEIEFSKAIIYSPNAYELLNYSYFLKDLGQLDKALMLLNKVIADINSSNEAIAYSYSSKGTIMKIRGDFKGAITTYKKSLTIYKKLKNKEGIATNYSNIGMLERRKGNLDEAEKMYKKALKIYEEIDSNSGIAIQYANLGVLMVIREKLDEAKIMFQKALKINQQINRKKGVSYNYIYLGNIKSSQGDFDGAEIMYMKSLEIEKQLGRKEGIASVYINLGILKMIKGDFKGAKSMYVRCLGIAEKHGFAEIIRKTNESLERLKQEKEKNNS